MLLKKISRKHFCEEVEGKKLVMIDCRPKAYLEADLKKLEAFRTLQENNINSSLLRVFHTKSNGFVRIHPDGQASYFTWSKGDCAYKCDDF